MALRNGKSIGDDVAAYMQRFGLNYREMAEHIGTTESTVRSSVEGSYLVWKSDLVAFEVALRTPPGGAPVYAGEVLG